MGLAFKVAPNPFTRQAVISLQNAPFGSAQGDKMKNAKLEIFDSSGRKVLATCDMRRVTYIWDGRNNQGKILPGGIYYICLKDDRQVKTVTVNLVR